MLEIPRNMTNEESRIYAGLIVAEREIAYHKAIAFGLRNRLARMKDK